MIQEFNVGDVAMGGEFDIRIEIVSDGETRESSNYNNETTEEIVTTVAVSTDTADIAKKEYPIKSMRCGECIRLHMTCDRSDPACGYGGTHNS